MIVYSIGAANIDIIADIASSETGIDRRGSFQISLGGTAFNVAVNLAYMGANVVFITALRKESLFSTVILNKIKESGITVETVYPAKKDSIFLAFRMNKSLKFAVNSVPIEDVVIENILLSSDVKGIFVDFNNSKETIRNLVCKAYKHRIPVFTNFVSETKALKFVKSPVNFFTVVSCHVSELKPVLEAFCSQHIIRRPSIQLLSKKYTPYFLVTSDCDGAALWKDGELISAVMPPEGKVINFSGAGDAMISGFMYGMLYLDMSPQEALLFANQAVKFVLQKKHTNLINSNQTIDTSIIYKDKLTGLPTRAVLDTIDLKDFSVIVLDIDHFKKINDTYGHKIGDEVLKKFSSLITKSIRKHDIAIRWGGEEFVIILKDAQLEEAKQIAERIRTKVENTQFPIKQKVTCSGGIAASKNGNTSVSFTKRFIELFEEADRNLYKAKNSGRNRVES